jgi:hypothetical protein
MDRYPVRLLQYKTVVNSREYIFLMKNVSYTILLCADAFWHALCNIEYQKRMETAGFSYFQRLRRNRP